MSAGDESLCQSPRHTETGRGGRCSRWAWSRQCGNWQETQPPAELQSPPLGWPASQGWPAFQGYSGPAWDEHTRHETRHGMGVLLEGKSMSYLRRVFSGV